MPMAGYSSEFAIVNLDSAGAPDNVLQRGLTATVGDSASASFKPQLKLSAWDDECSFTINLRNGNNTVSDVTTGSINNAIRIDIAMDNNLRHSIYKRSDGNLEWEIILDRQPDSNVLAFDFTSHGLLFYFQDTSQVDSITRSQSIFPDSTIFSWAAFHASHRDNRRIINNSDTTYINYETGKAFHIFRPRAVDAEKYSVWCDLDIDTFQNRLTITIPVEFLKAATYPVSIDPTIGETNGGVWFTNATNLLYALYYTHAAPVDDGQLNKMYLYSYRSNAASACSTRGYVYDYDATLSNCDLISSSNIIEVTNGTTSDDAQWNEMNISGAVSSSVEYMPAFRGNNNDLLIGYGFGTPGQVKYLTLNEWSAPSTLNGAGNFGNHWGCYFEYTISSEYNYRRRRLLSGGQ
jgi:molybdopterin-binding protein